MTTVSTPTPTLQGSKSRAWAGVVSLSAGVFAIVMAEFLPASLLPRIAEAIGVSKGTAGQKGQSPESWLPDVADVEGSQPPRSVVDSWVGAVAPGTRVTVAVSR